MGVAANAPPTVAPGESRQLFATATWSNGTTTDVTNMASWQSSNPVLATVNAGGLLTGAAEGEVDISATYDNVRGTLRAQVRRATCVLTLTPASASFNAFGGTSSVDVAVSPADCQWTARSDAPWFSFAYDPGRAGGGNFSYTVPPNSTPDARSTSIVVTSTTGQQSTHAISQGRPVSCSYVTRPESATFTAAGGTGSFDVITTPGDCQWRVSTTLVIWGVSFVSGFSGTGTGRVTYTVPAHTRSVDLDGFIEVHGLSGLNPPGRHHVIILKR